MPAAKPVNVGKATISEVGPKREPAIAAPLKTQDTSEGGLVKGTEELVYDPADLEVPDQEINEYLPSDKIPAGEIIYIRNNTRSIVRFADGYKSDASFNLLLKPAGDYDSIASVEQFGVLRNPGFQKWWKAGKVTVSSDPRLAPKKIDIGQIEIERHQQFALEGTIERTAPGSLPLPKDVDFSFLDQYNKKSPDYRF